MILLAFDDLRICYKRVDCAAKTGKTQANFLAIEQQNVKILLIE
jgi:hypothetical protein